MRSSTEAGLNGVVWLGRAVVSLDLPTVPTAGASWASAFTDGLALRRAGAEIVLVSGSDAELRRAVLSTTLGGARAVILFPTGAPRVLPAWERRFHRYVVEDQNAARDWARAGVALGRLIVFSPAYRQEALLALINEVRSVSTRAR